jgi:hypothetical protein
LFFRSFLSLSDCVIFGIIFGALTGLQPTSWTKALFVHIYTFVSVTLLGYSFLLGDYIGGMYGGKHIWKISSSTPGTAAAAGDCIGMVFPLAQPMAKQKKALDMALYASV